MSNFTDVAELNNLIGNPKGDPNNLDWSALRRQLKLIQEEFNELVDGVTTNNLTEVRDAIADVLVTTYGLAHRAGIDADADMVEVHRSNMSKFCTSMEEAIKTGAKYEKLDVQVSYKQNGNGTYTVRSARNQIGNDGKEYPQGKLLKSINFQEPNFQ